MVKEDTQDKISVTAREGDGLPAASKLTAGRGVLFAAGLFLSKT